MFKFLFSLRSPLSGFAFSAWLSCPRLSHICPAAFPAYRLAFPFYPRVHPFPLNFIYALCSLS